MVKTTAELMAQRDDLLARYGTLWQRKGVLAMDNEKTQIERVARAIYDADGYDEFFGAAPARTKERFYGMARAAIAALPAPQADGAEQMSFTREQLERFAKGRWDCTERDLAMAAPSMARELLAALTPKLPPDERDR